MLAKKYLDELMHFHEVKEAKEAEENKAKDALGKFIKEKNKDNISAGKSKIDFLIM